MASKKNRPTASDRSSAPVAEVPIQPVSAPASPAQVPTTTQRTALERTVIRAAKWLGSLQLAVLILTIFVIAMIAGTMVESWYSAKLAQDLVYNSWWFLLMMGGLFLNIFFAAAKKWPWKRHQTGFVITHIGLLMLITGGVVNSIAGVDSLMRLVSESNPELERQGVPQQSDNAFAPDQAIIEVGWPKHYGQNTRLYPFDPGQMQWHADEYLKPKSDPLLAVLSTLAEPFPRSWETNLDHGARLEVLNYYPYVKADSYRPTKEDSSAKGVPAIRFILGNPKLPMGKPTDTWVSFQNPGDARHDLNGIALVELLTPRPINAAQIHEFLNPPKPDSTGPMGELVVIWDGKPIRLPIEKAMDAPVPVGDGWSLKVDGYFAQGFEDKAPDPKEEIKKAPQNPILSLSLIPPNGEGRTIRMATSARRAEAFGLEGSPVEKRLRLWYNPPDYRYGNSSYRGLLQFALGDDGKLYYRAFNSATEKKAAAPVDPHTPVPPSPFKFELAAEAKVGGADPMTIWGGMEWKLRIPEFYASATPTPKPLDEPPGVLTNILPSAVRCKLHVGKESTEFWLIKDSLALKTISLGGETFSIGFRAKKFKLPFTIKLLRAEQTSDPGTRAAASFSSWVQVMDESNPKEPVFKESHIWMNHPLEYGGYKFYQTGMDMDIDRQSLKPIGFSTLTVAYDPGLWLKYLGSIFLALGIGTMFYMRAYFVKKPARKAVGTV